MTEKEVEELYKIAKHTIKICNIPYSEDLVQDMVTYAYDKIDLYEEEKGSKTNFLIYIMKKYILWKGRKRLKDIPKWAYLNANDYIDEECDLTYLDTFCDEGNNQKLMDEFINEIKPLMGEYLKLFMEGYSMSEIGKINNCSRQNIHKEIVKNIQKIKQHLIKTKQYDYYKDLVNF